MKYYGFKKKRYIENIKYKILKLRYSILRYSLFNKDKRDYYKESYNRNFIEPWKFREIDLSIPDEMYFLPICIVTTDLVLREDIPRLKKGLKKMLIKYYSHKFLGGQSSIEEIMKNIENMDDTLTSWYNSVNIGTLDFETDSNLSEYISYFDMHIKNINTSYLSLEFYIYPTENFQKELIEIINNDYEFIEGHVIQHLVRNTKASGGKKTYSIGHYNNAHLKSDLIYEQIGIFKWKFFNRMQRYFSTILHSKNINPPSINIYKTNKDYEEIQSKDFWDSIGILDYQGQAIDSARKLYFRTNLSGRYKNTTGRDLIYVVNETKVTHKPYYYSIDFQIIHELTEEISTNIFKCVLLDALNDYTSTILVSYKLKLNEIKLERNKLNKLLKMRYFYEKDMDFYKRFVSEHMWKDVEKNIATVFNSKHQKGAFDYRVLTESPVISSNKIIGQMENITLEFNDKISILQYLSEYKNENKNRRMNFIMLLISTLTFLFIIFPSLSERFARLLLRIWSYFIENI